MADMHRVRMREQTERTAISAIWDVIFSPLIHTRQIPELYSCNYHKNVVKISETSTQPHPHPTHAVISYGSVVSVLQKFPTEYIKHLVWGIFTTW
jgi:hypothetical protein